MQRIRLLAIGAFCTLAGLVWAEESSIMSLPPSVVKTSPECGAAKVDAATTTQIRVTFSKDMTDKSWSWSQISDETFPKIIGRPKYLADKRTCVIDVKLEPDKFYEIWLNSEKFHNFKDKDGKSAVPYLLEFKTSPAGSAAPAGPANEAEKKKAAAAAAETWLHLVDEEKYAESWKIAAGFFQNAVSQAELNQALAAARKPLGKVISRELKIAVCKTSLPGAPDGQYVILEFEASFENKKSAIETITPMLDKDGQWRVSGYYIK